MVVPNIPAPPMPPPNQPCTQQEADALQRAWTARYCEQTGLAHCIPSRVEPYVSFRLPRVETEDQGTVCAIDRPPLPSEEG